MQELQDLALTTYADEDTITKWRAWDGQDEAYNDLLKPYADKPLWTLYPTWFYKALERLCKRSGVTFKGVHAIRHSFVTKALQTWNIQTLSRWIGHKDINLTFATYGHMLPEDPPEFDY